MIALTSLTSEADVKRGREAGMDDYQVKLDREQIMTRRQPAVAAEAKEAAAAPPPGGCRNCRRNACLCNERVTNCSLLVQRGLKHDDRHTHRTDAANP